MSTATSPLMSESGDVRLVARGPWHDLARRLARDWVALLALSFAALLVLAAVVGAPLSAHLTGHGPNEQFQNALDLSGVPLGPWQHEFAPDGLQHDPHSALFVL